MVFLLYGMDDNSRVWKIWNIWYGNSQKFFHKNQIAPSNNGFGYYQIKLRDLSGERKTFYVHRLVYTVFCGEIPDEFEIHHINYDSSDNRLSNLAMVTHRENMIWNYIVNRSPNVNVCPSCFKQISPKAKKCSNCHSLTTRLVKRPSKEELIKLIQQKTWVEIGRSFGVSDNAVRKWAKSYKII